MWNTRVHEISAIHWFIHVDREHPCYFKTKMADEGTMIIVRLTVFERYYANLLHTGDTKDADNLVANIICQDILINVILDCESEL